MRDVGPGLSLPAPRARIQVPHRAVGALERTTVLDDMSHGTMSRGAVVLVCAPAGYGKTTLLTQWAARATAVGHSVAWVTCSEMQADPASLFLDVRDAMALALADDAPQISGDVIDLAAPTPAATDSPLGALAVLLDELPSPLTLILDDVHALDDPASLALVEDLALRTSTGLHLALGTRTEPQPLLAELRMRVPVVEIRTPELALTPAEVARLVREAGGDAEMAVTLTEQTQGWPAAVRLGVVAAGTGLAGGRATTPLIRDSSIAGFLSSVLAGLDPQAVSVLRDTAVAAELEPGLARALTGRADAEKILARLCRAQLLVRRMGSAHTTYIVHGLLRSHVLADLAAEDPDSPRRKHAVAASWFAAHGNPGLALQHASRAADPALLRSLIHRAGAHLVATGRSPDLLDALEALPRHVWDADTLGLAALAWADQGDIATARHLLSVREPGPTPAASARSTDQAPYTVEVDPCALPPLCRVAAFHVRRLEGRPEDPALPVAFADVLAWQPDPSPPPEDVDTLLLLLVSRGQWEYAVGRYEESWADLRLALGLATLHRRDRITLQAMGTLAGVPAIRGDAAGADYYVSAALELIESRGWSRHPAMANIYAAGAWAASLMLLPDRAGQMILRAEEAVAGTVDPEYTSSTAAIGTPLRAERPGEAEQALATLAGFAHGGTPGGLTPAAQVWAGMQRVRILLRLGDLAGAAVAVRDLEVRWPGRADPLVARAQLHQARGEWAACRAVLHRVQSSSTGFAAPANEIVAPLLACLVAHAAGDNDEARLALRRALDIAGPRGVVRPFWDAGPVVRTLLQAQTGRFGIHEDFVSTILRRWEQMPSSQQPRSLLRGGVLLTPREVEILRELPSLMTAAELAAEHVVSVNTIRTHMRTLYQKLGAHTRRDAVRRGRELGFL